MREDWDRLFGAPAAHRMIRPDIIGGVPVAWIGGEGASAERVFIYLHGGGYQIGSPRSHADLVARISAASGATGLVIDYRLAAAPSDTPQQSKRPSGSATIGAFSTWSSVILFRKCALGFIAPFSLPLTDKL